jgi:hypothetical protein
MSIQKENALVALLLLAEAAGGSELLSGGHLSLLGLVLDL